MNLLYPRFPAKHLPAMLRVALLGAALAGGYGALHDQISYAVSPEYFTKLKFRQFSYADFGCPPRLFASEVGFLGTWWVGLLAGWFLSRGGLVELPPAERRRCTVRALGLVLLAAAVGGLLGSGWGVAATRADLSAWHDWRELGVEDLRAFVIVAHLHTGGYVGALVGLILALVTVWRRLGRARRVLEVAGWVRS